MSSPNERKPAERVEAERVAEKARAIPEFSPTPEQAVALTHPAPILVLAGPGTGKTTVLTRRIARAILEGEAEPHEILALTFTDKAAAEMAERLSEVLGEAGRAQAAREVTCGTFHSFGGLIVRENLLRLGFDRPPQVLTTPGAWQLLGKLFDELEFEAIELTGSVGTAFARLLGFFSQCKDHLVGPEDIIAYVEGYDLSRLSPVAAEYLGTRLVQLREVAAAYRKYEEAKRDSSLIDFGDHLYLPVRLFREAPEVRDAYRERYRVVFVDEYQDTNHAQRELLLQLLDPRQPRIMVIGDDDQAIYRWRGAVVQNILRFHEERLFAEGGVEVKRVSLTLNRRSYPPVLDLANLAIARVAERHPKALKYHPKHAEGRAVVGRHVAASDTAEGEWIAARIRELLPEARKLEGRKRGYGAFAVLCRRRSLFAPVCEALEKARIPYEVVGGTGFYGRWEIRDILSYLMLLADPADDLALARILRSRRWKLSARDICHLSAWAQGANGDRGHESSARLKGARLQLLDAVFHVDEVKGLSPEAGARLQALRGELREYEQLRRRRPLGELVTHVVERTGYRRELRALPGFDARVALLNLDKLEALAREFGEGQGASLPGFVEFVRYSLESGEEEGEVRPIDEGADAVKVMTVHAAKGLEFPYVFVPGLAERVFPTQGRDESEAWYSLPVDLRGGREHLQRVDLAAVSTVKGLEAAIKARKEAEQTLRLDEERRLFYVAITRAERGLFLTRAHWYGGTKQPRPGSEFWEVVESSGSAEDLGEDECPTENPNLAAMASGDEAETDGTRPTEPDYPSTLLLTGEDPAAWLEATARREGYGRWTVLRAEVDSHLASLAQSHVASLPTERVTVSCSGLLLYHACPRHYRYVYVDRLPTRPSRWAELGEEVHRRIEELSRPTAEEAPPAPGRQPTPDEDEPRPTDEQAEELVETVLAGGDQARGEDTQHAGSSAYPHRVSVDDLLACYRKSIYASRPATHVELPFEISLPSGTLRGRIDRLDRLESEGARGARWDVVDYKAGAHSLHAEAAYRRQLALYALAIRDLFGAPAATITAHLLFLCDGSDLALTFDDAALDRVRTEAEAALAAIARGEYPAGHDAASCAGCDYIHLCLDRWTEQSLPIAPQEGSCG